MAFIPVIDVLRVVHVFKQNARTWTITQWFRKAGFDQSDQLLLTSQMSDWVVNELMPTLVDNCEYERTQSYDMNSSEGYVDTELPVGPTFGSDTNAPAPLSACVVMTLRTNFRGRSGRGRNYISGLSETDTDDRYCSLAKRTAIEGAYSQINSYCSTYGFDWGIVSFQHNKVELNPGVFKPITAWEIRGAALASQRLRIGRS